MVFFGYKRHWLLFCVKDKGTLDGRLRVTNKHWLLFWRRVHSMILSRLQTSTGYFYCVNKKNGGGKHMAQ